MTRSPAPASTPGPWIRAALGITTASLSAAVFVSCGSDGSSGATPPQSDASAQDGPDAAAPCTPKTCAQLEASCGEVPDGCGGITECGACTQGLICGGDGPNRCGTNTCRPKTCVQLEASCGLVSDGCADVLDCGGCPAPQVCGDASKPNQCGCSPRSCVQMEAECGSAPDGCGGVITCGECHAGLTCGGAGQNRCGSGTCAAKTCSQVGASCGIASDGCSDVVDCGSCAPPGVCGGSGVVNQCGCTNKTCAQLDASCGTLAGGCGSQVDCGSCPPDDTCGGGSIANQCGCACQLPNATTTCAGGDCHIRYCDDGWGNCDGSQETGCETDLMGDVSCPAPCETDDQCPLSYSCIADRCTPWPLGLVVPWGGGALPNGWLEADGSAISRTTWSALFKAIGTAFGPGDGTTTFQLPDLRGRLPLGQTQTGTGSRLADRFGALDHTHTAVLTPHEHGVTVAAHTHDIAALPPHTHPWYFTLQLNANPGPNPVLLKSQTGETEPATGGPFTSSADPGGGLTTSGNASTAAIQPANPPYLAMRPIVLAKAGADVPCGAVWYHAKDAPPAGSRSAIGTAVSRTSEAWLFNCLKTAFGAGDGSTTFNLPDLRGRAALGRSASGTGSKVGDTGGSLGHTHASAVNAIAHTLPMPAHSHTAAEPEHYHAVVTPTPGYSVASGYQFGCITGLEPATGTSPGETTTSGVEPAHDVTVPSAGTGNVTATAGEAPFLVLRPALFQSPSHRIPRGTVSAFAGAKVPAGWLVADGSAVSRSTYAELFAVIGTAFGAGDGSTTFNLPDLRGRTALGKADTGPGAQLAAFGGSLDHTHELTAPAHSHSIVFPSHTHPFNIYHHIHTLGHTQIIATDDFAAVESARGVGVQVNSGGGINTTSQPGVAPPAVSTPGGGGTFSTQSANAPYLVLRYLIRS